MFNKLHYIENYNAYTWKVIRALHESKATTRKEIVDVLVAHNINIFILKFMLVSLLNIELIDVLDADRGDDATLIIRKDILDNYTSLKYPINVFALFEHSIQRLVFKASNKQIAIVKASADKTTALLDNLYDFLYEYLSVVYKE